MADANIVIVDYGLSNLFNLEHAFIHIGARVTVSEDAETVAAADALVLPGVGAFEEGIHNMRRQGLVEPIRKAAVVGKPILGICLGMQMFATESEEGGLFPGLDLVPGRVRRLLAPEPDGHKYKIPLMGWTGIAPANGGWTDTILDGCEENAHFYFLHSYVLCPDDAADSLAMCAYGRDDFAAVVRRANVVGCQFHPERSGPAGLRFLRNFTATATASARAQ